MYWETLDKLVNKNRIVIDRKKGTAHPKYAEAIYPVDYGYLENTKSMDGGGIDIFVGSLDNKAIQGIICTIDELKQDSEIKILYSCTDEEIAKALEFLNKGAMSAMLIRNERTPTTALI